MFFNKILHRVVALLVEDMFNPASILDRNILWYSQLDEPLRYELMPLIDQFRDAFPGIREIDKPRIRDRNMVLFAKVLHCDADARLLKTQFVCDVHGTDDGKFPA